MITPTMIDKPRAGGQTPSYARPLLPATGVHPGARGRLPSLARMARPWAL
jgi:hypothetical protein